MKEFIKQLLRRLLVLVDGGPQITEQQQENALQMGMCLDAEDACRTSQQSQCTHLKGGHIRNVTRVADIANGLATGNAPYYAVRKHMMINRDIWVDCLRCGKKWRPPLRDQFKKERDYIAALLEYDTAVKFPTNNTMSSSVLCAFFDRKTGKRADEQITKMYAAIGG